MARQTKADMRKEWESEVRNEIQGYLDTIQETEELADCYRRERDRLTVARDIYRERLNSLEDRLISQQRNTTGG